MAHPIVERPGVANVARFSLPPQGRPFLGVRRRAAAFRRVFEAVLLQQRGEVTAWEAKQLRTATKALASAMRIDNILAAAGRPGEVVTTEATKDGSTGVRQVGLSHEQHLAYLALSVRLEEACDRALRSIGLDRTRAADPWDAIYATAPPAAATPLPAADPAADRPAGPPDAGDAEAAARATATAGEPPAEPVEALP